MKQIFIDAGANTGQTLGYLAADPSFDGFEVHAFEPSPRHLPALLAKAAEFATRYRIHIHPYGLRGQSAVLPFHPKDDPRGDSFHAVLASDHPTVNLSPGYTLHVYAASAADWIVANTSPDDHVVLKLDVEGSEYDILAHLLARQDALSRVRRILVEWHTIETDSPMHTRELLGAIYSTTGHCLEPWEF